ncbi:Cyp6a9 [Trypoxylus dichotomus]
MSIGEWFAEFYVTMKARKVKHAGCFILIAPIYVPIDLDLLKRIMATDFTHFIDHRIYFNEKDDPLSAHLFALTGQKWRDLRVKLTPTFTSANMKLMLPIVIKVSQELITILNNDCQKGPVDVYDICVRFTTDVIANCAFGINCGSLVDLILHIHRT